MPVVLVVDDEQQIRNALIREFSDLDDYEVLAAESAAEAVRLLGQRNVDVIISDERMPMVVGSEFLRFAKDKYPEIPRIILTGYADQSATIQAINKAEVFRYLSKPWDSGELLEVVRQAAELKNRELSTKNLNLRVLTQKNELEMERDKLEKTLGKQSSQLARSLELLQKTSAALGQHRGEILGAILIMASHYDPAAAALANQIGQTYCQIADGQAVPYAADAFYAGLLAGALGGSRTALLPQLAGLAPLAPVVQLVKLMAENYNATGPQGFGAAAIPLQARLLRVIHDFCRDSMTGIGQVRERLMAQGLVLYDPDVLRLVLERAPAPDAPSATGLADDAD